MKGSQSWPAQRSESRVSLRSTKSVAISLHAPTRDDHRQRTPVAQPAKKEKPKRGLSFKQRMKNIKDNLMYAYDIKHSKKQGNFERMNSIRSSVRSGRSPYAMDFDETDNLISSDRPSNRRKRQSKSNGYRSKEEEVEPAVAPQRSRPPSPEARSRPVTPTAQSRPVTPDDTRSIPEFTRSRPVTPSRSRPASPELRSLGQTSPTSPSEPEFRVRSKTPDFRPRTPAAEDMPPAMSPPMLPDEHRLERNESGASSRVPLIKPTPGRLVTTQYQDSPRSSFRSNQTLL